MTIKLQCPSCKARLFVVNIDGAQITCRHCNDGFRCVDGVIHFVPDTLFTKLDDIDYDEHYSVSNESSQKVFAELKDVLGARLRESYGSLVEIGAGTGGFTKGLLTNINVGDAIVTDISSKMLSICRTRLLGGLHRAKSVTFATYSSAESIFPRRSIDCVIGNFVLHHILDYKSLFSDLYRMLRNNGTVIFAEPGYKFHHALVISMTDVLETLTSEAKLHSDQDLIRLGNWIHELHFNLKYVGDPEVLRDREDKHLFLRDDVERSAFDAGFEHVETIPYGSRAVAASLESYLPQLGLTPSFLSRVTDIFDSYHGRYFRLLAEEDATPAHAFFFQKRNGLISSLFKQR